nr:RNA-directed DNA polymerase, eukaryota [Tanacetum cinerariifolium]
MANSIPKDFKGKQKLKFNKNKLVVGGKSRLSSYLYSSDLNARGLEEYAAIMNIDKSIGFLMKGNSLNINGLGLDCKTNWVRDLVASECPLLFGIQKTNLDSINHLFVRSLWSRQNVDFIYSSSVGAFGGLLTMWDPGAFFMESHVVNANYLCAFGSLARINHKVSLLNIYAPQASSDKAMLWNSIENLLNSIDEVKAVVWSFSGSKSLGPDGFNFNFIKAY